jgi:Mrp family chromosome partitioning ATPase
VAILEPPARSDRPSSLWTTTDSAGPAPVVSPDAGLGEPLLGSIALVETGPVDAEAPARMKRLIAEIRARFGVVLVDLPPVRDSTYTLTLAGIVDVVYLVVEAGRERREVVSKSVQALQRAGYQVGGVVLNKHVRAIPDVLYRWL